MRPLHLLPLCAAVGPLSVRLCSASDLSSRGRARCAAFRVWQTALPDPTRRVVACSARTVGSIRTASFSPKCSVEVPFRDSAGDANHCADDDAEMRTGMAATLTASLNDEQKRVLQLALDGASLFIGGNAGTGKSYLVRCIAAALREEKKLKVAVTASTGIAALNISGTTYHSTFGIPIKTEETTCRTKYAERCKVSGVPAMAVPRISELRLLASVDVIIIDEISLFQSCYLDALDCQARLTPGRDPQLPFGGIQVILSGDFLQLVPWSPKETIPKQQRIKGAFARCRKGGYGAGASFFWPSTEQVVKKEATSAPSELASFSDSSRMAKDTPEKLMFEGLAFQKFLLPVELREQRRQLDGQFLAELNELRRGVLPHRLSRSAVLNPPAHDAVRLFATRSAVMNYNECKMLELEGQEREFPIRMLPFPSRPNGDADERYTSAPLLLYWQPGCIRPSHRRSAVAAIQKENIHFAEMLQQWIGGAALPWLHCQPFPFNYFSGASISTALVRCTGSTRGEAAKRRQQLLEALLPLLQKTRQTQQTPCSQKTNDTTRRGLALRLLTTMPSRWELVRLTEMTWSQVNGMLRSHLHYLLAYNKDLIDTVAQARRLKVGCRVMLLRNLSPTYVNGSLGTIVRFEPQHWCYHLLPAEWQVRRKGVDGAAATLIKQGTRSPFPSNDSSEKQSRAGVLTASGHGISGTTTAAERDDLPIVRMDQNGCEVAIPWVSVPLPNTVRGDILFFRLSHMPLCPAYAFTVHKTQGITLDHPVLFDAAHLFPCDHIVYVAASRVRQFSHLRILNLSPAMVSVNARSLAFTSQLQSVEEVAKRWKDWCSGSGEVGKQQWFLPSWKTRRDRRS